MSGGYPEQTPVVMALIAELAVALGISSIGEYDGCWAYCLDHDWQFAVNGHDHNVSYTYTYRTAPAVITARANRAEQHTVTVPPYSAFIVWRDWPAGIIDLNGGVLAAGEAANEAALIAALDRAIAKANAGATKGGLN